MKRLIIIVMSHLFLSGCTTTGSNAGLLSYADLGTEIRITRSDDSSTATHADAAEQLARLAH